MDLCFNDSQPAGFFGLNKEFISAARLDNLFSCWAAIRAISDDEFCASSVNSSYVSMINLFDNEECGS